MCSFVNVALCIVSENLFAVVRDSFVFPAKQHWYFKTHANKWMPTENWHCICYCSWFLGSWVFNDTSNPSKLQTYLPLAIISPPHWKTKTTDLTRCYTTNAGSSCHKTTTGRLSYPTHLLSSLATVSSSTTWFASDLEQQVSTWEVWVLLHGFVCKMQLWHWPIWHSGQNLYKICRKKLFISGNVCRWVLTCCTIL